MHTNQFQTSQEVLSDGDTLLATVALLQPPLYIAPHSIPITLCSTIITYLAFPAHVKFPMVS